MTTLLKVKTLSEISNSLARIICSTGSTHVKSTGIEAASTEDTCTRSFCIKTANIGGVGDTFIRVTSVKYTV